MASYTTAADVAAELGGVTINTTSTPTTNTVNTWISDASDEIEQVAGRVFSVAVVTSDAYEYHDYDASGKIRLVNAPVISVESVEYANDLNATAVTWSALSEGRTSSTHFVTYLDEGVLLLRTTAPKYGTQNIRCTYTYGYLSTPRWVKRLCTLLVAKRYILSVANKSASTEGGAVSVGTIRVDDPNNYVHTHLQRVNTEIDLLWQRVGSSFKSYSYDSTLYD